MRLITIFLIFSSLFIFGCSNPSSIDGNSYSYDLAFQFSTLGNPNSLVVDAENEFVYVSSGKIHFAEDDLKIQKFTLDGELLTTIIDFNNYSNGLYPKYSPLDIALDDEHNICILVKPYKNNEDWESYDGFCIMTHNSDGVFQKEFDYSKINLNYNPEVITYENDFFFVTNSFSLFKISKSSEQLLDIPLPKVLDNTFPENFISDLVVNGNENIWFVGQTKFDSLGAKNYIAKMNSEGNQLFKFNSVNQTPILHSALSQPAIQLDEESNIYITTFSCKSLEIYNSVGKLLGEYDFNKLGNEYTLPIDLGLDKTKNIYVLDNRNDKVYVLNKKKV